MHGPPCIFWAKLTPFSLQESGRWGSAGSWFADSFVRTEDRGYPQFAEGCKHPLASGPDHWYNFTITVCKLNFRMEFYDTLLKIKGVASKFGVDLA
jgi:hypothetical protein